MDRIIYLFAASYVSAGQTSALIDRLVAAAPCAAQAIRLDGTGDGLWAALDRAVAEGARRIELRPLGLPFSESLLKWLPGAAGSWLSRQPDPLAIDLRFADVPTEDPAFVHAAANARCPTRGIQPKPRGHIGKGWDTPPAFRHHLLVCTGPRCHMLDAPGLLDVLKRELAAANMARDCLVTATGCLFPCNGGPVVVHYPSGDWYRLPDRAAIRDFVVRRLAHGELLPHLVVHQPGVFHEPA